MNKGLDNGIVTHGCQRRHIESCAETGIASFSQTTAPMDRSAGVMLTRGQAGIGGQLCGGFKTGNVGYDGYEVRRRRIADAGNGCQEVPLFTQLRMLVDQVVNGLLKSGDLRVESQPGAGARFILLLHAEPDGLARGCGRP